MSCDDQLTDSFRFLWIKFQLDELCAAETDSAIRRVLLNLTRDLGETYDRLLGRIDGTEQRGYIRRMFNWMLQARQPLLVKEMNEAIAFATDHKAYYSTKIPNDLQHPNSCL